MALVSGWNWCHRCGHREEGEAPDTADALGPSSTRHSRSGDPGSELALAFRVIPTWGWFLIGGLCCIPALSLIANYYLPENPRVRAI
jgi:hypothetical protein